MSRRDAIALTPEERRRFLEEARTIVLSTLDRRGYPHSVAMWYAVEPDGSVVMTTYAKSQKALNVRRDPRCSLLVERGQTYDELKGLLIRGRATLEAETPRVLAVLQKIHEKHGMPGTGDELRDALTAQARKRVVIRIHPEHVASWDHAKLGGTY